MHLGQLVPEASPEARLWDRIQLRDEWLDIPPCWSQGFAVAATRIRGKVIDLGDDLLIPLQQIVDRVADGNNSRSKNPASAGTVDQTLILRRTHKASSLASLVCLAPILNVFPGCFALLDLES